MRGKGYKYALFLILLFAFIVRIGGIKQELPYHYYGDEDYLIYHALKFGTGDLNPHWFVWPQFFEYILFFVYGIYFLIGSAVGIFENAYHFIFKAYLKNPTLLYLFSRGLVAFMGTATVIFFFKTYKKLYDELTAFLAIFILAFSPLHVKYSHLAVTDVPMLFMMSISFYFLVPVFKGDFTHKDLIKGGFFLGVATATKYPAVIFSVGVIYMLLYLFFKGTIDRRRLLFIFALFGIFLFLGFFISSPFCILDFDKCKADIANLWQTSHLGWRGWENINAFVFHFKHNLSDALGWPILLFSLGGIVWMMRHPIPKNMALFIFILIYYIIFGTSRLYYDRFILPLIPFLSLFAALLLTRCFHYLHKPKAKAILFLAVMPIMVVPFIRSAALVARTNLPDTRAIAKQWIEQNIPKGARIILDPAGPPLEQNPEEILSELREKREPVYGYHKGREKFYHLKAKKAQGSIWYNLFPITYPIAYLGEERDLKKKIQATIDAFQHTEEFDYLVLTDYHWNKFLLSIVPVSYYPYRQFYQMFEQREPMRIFLPVKGKMKGPVIKIFKL